MVLFSPFRAKNTPMQSLQVAKRDHYFGTLCNAFDFCLILFTTQNQKSVLHLGKERPAEASTGLNSMISV